MNNIQSHPKAYTSYLLWLGLVTDNLHITSTGIEAQYGYLGDNNDSTTEAFERLMNSESRDAANTMFYEMYAKACMGYVKHNKESGSEVDIDSFRMVRIDSSSPKLLSSCYSHDVTALHNGEFAAHVATHQPEFLYGGVIWGTDDFCNGFNTAAKLARKKWEPTVLEIYAEARHLGKPLEILAPAAGTYAKSKDGCPLEDLRVEGLASLLHIYKPAIKLNKGDRA